MEGPDGGSADGTPRAGAPRSGGPDSSDGEGTIIHGAPASQGTTTQGTGGPGRASPGSVAIVAGEAVEPLLGRLLSQAYLFDDPATYEAGVRDAYELLTRAAAHGAAA